MITTALLLILYGVISLLLTPISLLADVTLNGNFASSLTTASGYYHALNSILPVDTMLIIFGISLTFELAYLTFKVIMWVLAKIPFIN